MNVVIAATDTADGYHPVRKEFPDVEVLEAAAQIIEEHGLRSCAIKNILRDLRGSEDTDPFRKYSDASRDQGDN